MGLNRLSRLIVITSTREIGEQRTVEQRYYRLHWMQKKQRIQYGAIGL